MSRSRIVIALVLISLSLGPAAKWSSASAGPSRWGKTGELSVSPRRVALTFTRRQHFTAHGPGSAGVIWFVDGVQGGTAVSGLITSAGRYTPPKAVGSHTVRATTADDAHSAIARVFVTDYPGNFTYHNDRFRSGHNLLETVLGPGNVKPATFGKLFSYPLDGLTFASPLYVANVRVPGKGFHNLVYVATEHDSVYAFDADGRRSTPIWHRSFIDPAHGVTTVPASDTEETGDIPIEIGITSTPVIDPGTHTLYVVAKTKEVVSGQPANYVFRLHALDIATGAEKLGGPTVITATVPGTGLGSQGGQLPFNSLRQNQRTGLLLAKGVVYFGFSSHGDREPFHGWVMGYDATTLDQVMAYCSTPDGNDGGIWMNGDGIATDATGSLFFITGDGDLNAHTGGNDYGDSFVRISPGGVARDFFAPSVQSDLDAADLDLGSGGVLLLPKQAGPHPYEMVSAGKNGTIYLVDRTDMGSFDETTDHVVQELVNIFTEKTGIVGGNFSSPVFFNGRVYFSPVIDHVQAFRLNNGLLSTSATSESAATYGGRGGTLSISANRTRHGILWALESKGSSPGTLHAYAAGNLGTELYTSDSAGSRDTLGPWMKFSLPVIANGKVYVETADPLSDNPPMDNRLVVYGLLP